jgi:TonB family protein
VSTPSVEPAQPVDASGEVVDRVLPAIDDKARRSVRGRLRVRVRVNVDESGAVRNAKIESRGGSRYFGDRSLEAARKWTFKPPVVNGKNVPSDWNLTFEFTRAETRAAGKPL